MVPSTKRDPRLGGAAQIEHPDVKALASRVWEGIREVVSDGREARECLLPGVDESPRERPLTLERVTLA